MTVLRCVSFLLLVIAGLVIAQLGPAAGPSTNPAALTGRDVATAFQVIAIAYGGWQSALYFIE
jgi:hypothetical protein